MIKMICMKALLKACNQHFYQLSSQIRFKIKAPFLLMSAGNANAFVWDRDVIMFQCSGGALWWVLVSGFNVAAKEKGKNTNSTRLLRNL